MDTSARSDRRRDRDRHFLAAERLVVLVGDLKDRLAEVDHQPSGYGTDVTIHRGEIHTIQTIGRNRQMNLTELAEASGVTKGAASQMVSRLSAKGLVSKGPGPAPRSISLDLTGDGWIAFEAHERLHEAMVEVVWGHFGTGAQGRIEEISAAIEDLLELVESYARRKR